MSKKPGEGWRQPPLFSAPGAMHNPRIEHRTMTVAALARDLADGAIAPPPFARTTRRWPESDAANFIETLLLGFPMAPILLVPDDGGLVVVDGLQRIRAVTEFVDNRFRLSDLRQLTHLQSRGFRELAQSVQRRLLETHLPVIVASGPDAQSLAVELFRRMNEKSITFSEADLRAVSLDGEFYRFARQCADLPLFRELVDRKTALNEAERLELVLRFFAFSDRYDQFSHHVAAFIDQYIADMNRGPFPRERMMSEFHDTMTYVKARFPYGFRKSAGDDRVPRVRFESLAIGVNLAMRQGIVSHPDLSWLETAEFRTVIRTEASNSKIRLAARVEFVRNRLLRGN